MKNSKRAQTISTDTTFPANFERGNLHDKAFFKTEIRERVHDLVRSATDFNVRGEGGWTLLHLVARNGTSADITTLLNADADINMREVSGKTPLHVAAKNSSRAC